MSGMRTPEQTDMEFAMALLRGDQPATPRTTALQEWITEEFDEIAEAVRRPWPLRPWARARRSARRA